MPSSRQASSYSGVIKADTVKDCAESVGITNLSEEVASALAGDVEYRLHELMEEAVKFMKHARRTVLKAEDVDHALQSRNADPLWGFSLPSNAEGPTYLKTQTANGTIYVQEDEEIDLTKMLSLPMPHLPRQISYTAHWLAVEGVQPAIPANPSPQEIEQHTNKMNASRRTSLAQHATKDGTEVDVRPLVKHVLSRELQLYFDRLIAALLPPEGSTEGEEDVSNLRAAALASLRNDQGLAGLLPYLIQFAAEKVALIASNSLPLSESALLGDVSLNMIESLLENKNLFIEPYLHQLMPIMITCLINAASPMSIRHTAAGLLANLVARYAKTYPSLKPRIVKTLLRALIDPDVAFSTRHGAILGIRNLGSTSIQSVLGSKKNLVALGSTLDSTADVRLAQNTAELVVDALLDALPRDGAIDTDYDTSSFGQILGEMLKSHSYLIPLLDEGDRESSVPAKRAASVLS